MNIETLDDLLVEELRDLYSAEKQITKALPKMAKAVSSEDLRQALQNHLEETKGHVERLDQIFQLLGKSSRGKTCEGMKGLLSEGDELIEEVGPSDILDAGLISAAQRVEHYEMAGYGSVRSLAELLDKQDIAELLQTTLDEEKTADQTLTEISKSVNTQAQKAA